MTRQDTEVSNQSGSDREIFFARLAEEHACFLYRVAYSLLRHAQDAEDAVQDALLKLYRGESWRGMQDERAFLARVVWRAALDRRAARRAALTTRARSCAVLDTRPSPELAAAVSDDERALLQELIEALPEELKQPLLLSAVEEMSSREIGEVMGLPEGTVRTRLMRARSELRMRFEALNAAGREVAAGERSRR
jgi:RNA polymerase sigma-70 factor (ECF subfamily)